MEGNIGNEPIRPKYEAAVGKDVEHKEMIKSREEKVVGWFAEQTRLQERFDVLSAGLNRGLATASGRGMVEMDVALRNANKKELDDIRDEFADLAEKILENDGKPRELVENNDSLDFTAPETVQ